MNINGLLFTCWSDTRQRITYRGRLVPMGDRKLQDMRDRAHKWRCVLMVRMPDGDIVSTEVKVRTRVKLQDIDDVLHDHRVQLLQDNPGYLAHGWELEVIG